MSNLLKKVVVGGCFCLSVLTFHTGTINVEAAVDAPSSIEVEADDTVDTVEKEEDKKEETKKEKPKKETKKEKEISMRKDMVSYSKKFLGNRYVYGGTSLTRGTDCSGFTMRVYQKFGYKIPRTSRSQASASKRVSSAKKQPGDLIFYGYGRRVNHVAMYIGNGKIIHASNRRDGIKISRWNYKKCIKIGRFI